MGWPEGKSKISRRFGRDPEEFHQEKLHSGKNQISKIEDLDYFYPTSTLVTAQEILFFWVARMIMAGLEFMKDIPFKDVYIHGTVRDEKGRKMSKSLGNIIDPLQVIDEYGADALRYSLISITAMGQDVFLSREKFLMGRNFTNKIWNAARFIFLNIEPLKNLVTKEYDIHDKWILSSFQKLVKEVTSALENYNFNEASSLIYDYFWHKFCDWYIEFSKLVFQYDNKEKINKSKAILIYILDNLLRLLHPFMPFISEEIWQKFRPYFSISYKCLGLKFEETDSIMKSSWPRVLEQFIDEESEEKIQLLIEIIQMIRNIRAELDIKREEKLDILIESRDKNRMDIFEKYKNTIKLLANVKEVNISQEIIEPKHSALGIVKGCKIYLLLEGILDVEKEKNRLSKKLEDYNKKLTLVEERLKNKEFINKADEDVIEKTKKRRDELLATISHFKSYLDTL
jgi:valyl-tRNA synthetase